MDGKQIGEATVSVACVKCGSQDVTTSFHPRRSYCDPHSRFTFSSTDGEHLHRSCRCCGYDWTTSVLGSPPSVSAVDVALGQIAFALDCLKEGPGNRLRLDTAREVLGRARWELRGVARRQAALTSEPAPQATPRKDSDE